jgi:hypothetical protein
MASLEQNMTHLDRVGFNKGPLMRCESEYTVALPYGLASHLSYISWGVGH